MSEYTRMQRRRLLREIIENQGIGDQVHLLEKLKDQGIETTQATVSRDLQEMGYVKVRIAQGVYKYEQFEKSPEGVLWNRLKVLFENFVTDVKSTNNLVLVKTSPGNANGVASLIDGLQNEEILGTIAGDDTILVIVKNDKSRKRVEHSFRSLLEGVTHA